MLPVPCGGRLCLRLLGARCRAGRSAGHLPQPTPARPARPRTRPPQSTRYVDVPLVYQRPGNPCGYWLSVQYVIGSHGIGLHRTASDAPAYPAARAVRACGGCLRGGRRAPGAGLVDQPAHLPQPTPARPARPRTGPLAAVVAAWWRLFLLRAAARPAPGWSISRPTFPSWPRSGRRGHAATATHLAPSQRARSWRVVVPAASCCAPGAGLVDQLAHLPQPTPARPARPRTGLLAVVVAAWWRLCLRLRCARRRAGRSAGHLPQPAPVRPARPRTWPLPRRAWPCPVVVASAAELLRARRRVGRSAGHLPQPAPIRPARPSGDRVAVTLAVTSDRRKVKTAQNGRFRPLLGRGYPDQLVPEAKACGVPRAFVFSGTPCSADTSVAGGAWWSGKLLACIGTGRGAAMAAASPVGREA